MAILTLMKLVCISYGLLGPTWLDGSSGADSDRRSHFLGSPFRPFCPGQESTWVVRRGNLCTHLLSEALGLLLDEVISDVFEIKIMKLLSKPTLHWVLGRNPDLMRHFCLDKVIDQDPPRNVLEYYLSVALGIDVTFEGDGVLCLIGVTLCRGFFGTSLTKPRLE